MAARSDISEGNALRARRKPRWPRIVGFKRAHELASAGPVADGVDKRNVVLLRIEVPPVNPSWAVWQVAHATSPFTDRLRS
jgi:hypothetical protein